jgi:Flp pilus assembly pilin Flp
MQSLLSRLWNDDAGFTISTELLFVVTMLVLGLITGWTAVRNSVDSELTELANAISALDQTYSFIGLSNCDSFTAGTSVTDTYATMNSGTKAPTTQGINVDRCTFASP